jgi:hypothetical protein
LIDVLKPSPVDMGTVSRIDGSLPSGNPFSRGKRIAAEPAVEFQDRL